MTQRRYMRVLHDLPSPQREVLSLRLIDRLSSEDVAAKLQMDVALVRRIQDHGLLQIRRSKRSA